MTTRLRPAGDSAAIRENEERLAVGGMRKPQRSITKLPGVVAMGRRLREVLERAVSSRPDLSKFCLQAIGAKDGADRIPQGALDDVRAELAVLFGVRDTSSISDGFFSTELRAHLLEGWRAAAGDPDWAVTEWLARTGVPAGLRRHPEDCGIFPRTFWRF